MTSCIEDRPGECAFAGQAQHRRLCSSEIPGRRTVEVRRIPRLARLSLVAGSVAASRKDRRLELRSAGTSFSLPCDWCTRASSSHAAVAWHGPQVAVCAALREPTRHAAPALAATPAARPGVSLIHSVLLLPRDDHLDRVDERAAMRAEAGRGLLAPIAPGRACRCWPQRLKAVEGDSRSLDHMEVWPTGCRR